MRLSLVNLIKKMPHGSIWRGKSRLTPKIYPAHRAALREDIAREELNMYWLRHPYLTMEQTQGHVAHFNKHEKWLQEKRLAAVKQPEHVRLEDYLGHLRHRDSWEV